VNSNWIFITSNDSHYWIYVGGVQGDSEAYFGKSMQRSISYLVAKLAVL
jgi:hypothetical protein